MEKIIKISSNDEAAAIYGSLDENLKFAEKEFGVKITARNHQLTLSGSHGNVDKAHEFFNQRQEQFRQRNVKPVESEAEKTTSKSGVIKEASSSSDNASKVTYFHRGKLIAGRTKNQERYLEAMRYHDVTFGIGPAGTGKTYLAMAAALDQLKKKLVSKIILTRPAVEAGESLGFLPGDLQAKVNPYLRPLYDALYDMVDFEEASRYVERGVIEIAPIAYMRGRTLQDAFVILDEAQNCTHPQMKMFLTRLGQNSKMVITGDVTQIDLPSGRKSGLIEAQMMLGNVKGLKFIIFDDTDVVRHHLVQQIVLAYEKYERKNTVAHH
ncbi:MAG: PhoH family protein [Candidatus Omnitrophica bacterium]|nr:PhoH family protein [Candidatus Omnitrophota bacterium]